MLYGHEGCGKTTLAKWLAQAWLCTAEPNVRPCGECGACKMAASGKNPDLLGIEPMPPSFIIRLAAICPASPPDRDYPNPLTGFFRLSPLTSRNKVAIIEHADRMNADAANALLKTLEEPFPSQRLILTTRSIGSIIPTVVSRCLCLACPSPNPDPDSKRAIGGESWGQMARIQKNPDFYEAFELFASRLGERPPSEALVASDQLREFAEALQNLEDLTARQANAEICKLLGECLIKVRPKDVLAAEAVAKAHRRVLGNGNAGLDFDALMATIFHPEISH